MRCAALITPCAFFAALWPVPTHAQAPAQVAVVALAGPADDGTRLAESVRQSLAGLNLRVLSTEDTRQRMAGPRGMGQPVAAATVENAGRQADKLVLDEKLPEAVALMEGVIASLEADSDQTVEKAAWLKTARVRLAGIHLAQAGRAETGQANTDGGRRAEAQLSHIVQGDAGFALDPAGYPPRLRKLLERARAEALRLPRGSLDVTSHPAGATVFVDGRNVGITPLRINDVAAGSSYRVWLEHQGRRSLVRTVTPRPETGQLAVDLSVEGMLVPRLPALASSLADLDDGLLHEVAALLGVRSVVVVQQRPRDAAVLVFDADQQLMVRRGQLAGANPSDLGAVLARFSTVDSHPDVLALAELPPSVTLPRRAAVVMPSDASWPPALAAAFERAVQDAGIKDLVAPGALAAVLERCKQDAPCLLAGVKSLNADGLVVVTWTADKPRARLEAVLVDVKTGLDVRRVFHRVAHLGPPQAGELAVKLLAPARLTGGVDVRLPREGLVVWLDGVPIPAARGSAMRMGLAVGRHLLRVSGPGLSPAESEVDVPMGDPLGVAVTLSGQNLGLRPGAPLPEKKPPTVAAAPKATPAPSPAEAPTRQRPLWALALAGGGVLGAVVAALAGVGGGITAAVASALFASYPRAPGGGVVLRQGESPQQAQNRVGGTAAVAIAGGAVAAVGALLLLAGLGVGVGGVVAWWFL